MIERTPHAMIGLLFIVVASASSVSAVAPIGYGIGLQSLQSKPMPARVLDVPAYISTRYRIWSQ